MPLPSFRIPRIPFLVALYMMTIKPIAVAAVSVPLTEPTIESTDSAVPSSASFRQDPDVPAQVDVKQARPFFHADSNATYALTGNSNDDTPAHCFGTGVFRREAIPRDCVAVAKLFKDDPHYGDDITYTINRQRVGHGADRALPLDYFAGSCLLIISGKPGTYDEKFSLESQWPRLSNLIRKCIVEPELGDRWGGYITLGTPQKNGGFTALIGSEPIAQS